jgi:hypothetical protein
MTRHSAILIREGGSQITCDASGPHDNQKWAGWITFWKEDRPHISPLVSSDPVFDTAEDAIAAMELLVTQIREAPDTEIYGGQS